MHSIDVHLWRLLFTSILALTLAACPGAGDDDDATGDDDASGDDDTGDDDTGDDDTGDDDATGDDDTSEGQACGPLVGSWRLTRFECGEYDITDDWLDAIPSTILDVTVTAEGCTIVLTNSSPSCLEVEEFLYTVGEDTLSGENLGIVTCDPDACTFTEDDEPCALGDNAGDTTGEANFAVEADVLTVTNEEPEGLCGELTMVQTWERI